MRLHVNDYVAKHLSLFSKMVRVQQVACQICLVSWFSSFIAFPI
jgi:hypothetical protein